MALRKQFLKWIETLLNNQESYIINKGITTPYFKLKNGIHQGDPISSCLFCVIKSKKNIKGLNIFSHEFFYTAYADDTTFFLKDKISVFETLNIFHKFSLVSGLNSKTTNCEIAGIGTLKVVNVWHSVA